ncbi:MAG: hypothetical protein IKF49_06560 [Clostridia bacterium]|nr:hypothetical protein [Clostridia bacterium]
MNEPVSLELPSEKPSAAAATEIQKSEATPDAPIVSDTENTVETVQAPTPVPEENIPDDNPVAENEGHTKMKMFINDTEVSVVWEENESVSALVEMAEKAPVSIQMSMYGGFEQVGSIGVNLPRNDVQTTTQAGDIVLYSGNQIVVFYGSNSWAYTRLGKIEGLSQSELRSLLGKNAVELKITIE